MLLITISIFNIHTDLYSLSVLLNTFPLFFLINISLHLTFLSLPLLFLFYHYLIAPLQIFTFAFLQINPIPLFLFLVFPSPFSLSLSLSFSLAHLPQWGSLGDKQSQSKVIRFLTRYSSTCTCSGDPAPGRHLSCHTETSGPGRKMVVTGQGRTRRRGV